MLSNCTKNFFQSENTINHEKAFRLFRINEPSALSLGRRSRTSYGRACFGFIVGGGAALIDVDEKAAIQLGRSGIGTISDTYTLACASPNTNKAALAVLNWIEQR